MDSNDNDLFGDEGRVFDDPSKLPTDDLPTDAASLYSLVRDLTHDILQLEWHQAVYGQGATGRDHRTIMYCAQARKALGTPASDDAVEAGRRDFAEWFKDPEAGRIFLTGTPLEVENLVREAKAQFEKWMKEEGEMKAACDQAGYPVASIFSRGAPN